MSKAGAKRLELNVECDLCGKPINHGERIFQCAVGTIDFKKIRITDYALELLCHRQCLEKAIGKEDGFLERGNHADGEGEAPGA